MNQTSQLTIDPILPVGGVLLIGFALAVATVLIYARLGDTLSPGQKTALVLLRLCGVAMVVALLLQPSRLETIVPPKIDKVTVVAVDDSRSMAQRDTEEGTRTESAQALLREAGLVKEDMPSTTDLRLFRFSTDAVPMSRLSELSSGGETTRIHTSVTSVLGSLGAHEAARAIILLSDGHDFELVNPSRTGFNARARQTPIYAVALGKQGKVRDVSVRIANWQPYTYLKQKARITATLRLIGCELEPLTVLLKRDGTVVQRKKLPPTDAAEVSVPFDVVEEKVGQVEYEVNVAAVENEPDQENNSAMTFLNVIDQQIQVLFLEGAPYWDTTFLQRSFMRNDKMNVDSIVQYADGKARLIRKKPGARELRVPQTDAEWAAYDVVVLGRSVEKLLGRDALAQLTTYARDGGGTVVFSRGRAFEGELANNELEPVVWSQEAMRHVRLQPAREGQSLAPFRVMADPAAEGLPDLIAGRQATEKKALAATLAEAQGAQGAAMAGIIHRRFGTGQVLSVGVEGLWRWAFNSRVEGVNTVFDRFWDQMTLWLMAGRDFAPAQQFALRTSTANVPLGEKIYFRAVMREPKPGVNQIPLVVKRGTEEVARTALVPEASGPDKLATEFVPAKAGKYEATAKFPDGTEQTVRFMVFSDNLEKTEVATDVGFLKQLCESSGGRLLKPEELGPLVEGLSNAKGDSSPQTRLVPIWDRTGVFWVIGALFGADWFLRRRWGLT
jgi:hypothetical protein